MQTNTQTYTIEYLHDFRDRCAGGEETLASHIDQAEYIYSNRDEIILASKKFKVIELEAIVHPNWKMKKADLMSRVPLCLLQSLVIGENFVVYHGNEDRYEKCMQYIKSLTQDSFDLAIKDIKALFEERIALANARAAALENPQTYEDYCLIINAKGRASLSDEQLVILDALATEKTREYRKEQAVALAQRPAIELSEDLLFNIANTTHTKKGSDLFVLSLSQWIKRSLWLKLFKRCREFGGYYSSYNEGDAIPGFQFKTDTDRSAFANSILEGSGDLATRLEEAKAFAALKSSDRLLLMSQRLRTKAEASLNQDRKTNTHRRCAIAAHMEECAREYLQFADTMESLSHILANDPDHILSGIRYKKDIEQLESLLNCAKHTTLQEQAKDNFGTDWHRAVERDDVLAARIPSLSLHIDEARHLVHACEEAGAKMARAMLVKRIREASHENIAIPEKLALQLVEKLDGQPWHIANALTTRMRLNRMGIEKNFELRYALRAYLEIRGQKIEADPIVEMERALVGTNIDGFFPTTQPIIEVMLDHVDIQEGETMADPECGKGDLLSAAEALGAQVTGYEINHTLAEICRAKGFRIEHTDFLEAPHATYDVILMNPPFENKAAPIHIRKAYDWLKKDGGRLASVAPTSVLSGTDVTHSEFREWLETIDHEIIHNPEGSFLSSFRPTGVSTILIIMHK